MTSACGRLLFEIRLVHFPTLPYLTFPVSRCKFIIRSSTMTSFSIKDNSMLLRSIFLKVFRWEYTRKNRIDISRSYENSYHQYHCGCKKDPLSTSFYHSIIGLYFEDKNVFLLKSCPSVKFVSSIYINLVFHNFMGCIQTQKSAKPSDFFCHFPRKS